jgi:hypothetical protein
MLDRADVLFEHCAVAVGDIHQHIFEARQQIAGFDQTICGRLLLEKIVIE